MGADIGYLQSKLSLLKEQIENMENNLKKTQIKYKEIEKLSDRADKLLNKLTKITVENETVQKDIENEIEEKMNVLQEEMFQTIVNWLNKEGKKLDKKFNVSFDNLLSGLRKENWKHIKLILSLQRQNLEYFAEINNLSPIDPKQFILELHKKKGYEKE